jgi:hypothetical protein
MNLLDFTYWTQLNESTKVYYAFEIPKGISDDLNKAFRKELTDLLDEHSELFNYTLDEPYSGTISISFEQDEDEISSSIFGESTPFKIPIISPVSRTYSNGSFHYLTSDILSDAARVVLRGSIINKSQEKTSITLISDPGKRDELIDRIALRLLRIPNSPPKPSYHDYYEVFSKSKDTNQPAIDILTKKLQTYLKYVSIVDILNIYLVSESSPNLEEISRSIQSTLSNINSMGIDEVLTFQKKLLSQANKNRLEKDLTTAALIETFRRTLKEVGTPLEISKALNSI